MKVVFPCKGSIVLLKQDLETLNAFYNTTLLTSKVAEVYKSSNVMVQVGNFNYIPIRSSLVLYKSHLLTIEKMRNILGIYNQKSQKEKELSQAEDVSNNSSTPISDNDLLSNPFFQTLTPLN